ncbi:hypothetical protein SAMN05216559_0289 [Halomicrobium zhouii]|uniref:DUF8163 domain-containing protein n=1 Tax=Halomicrobium zhouii TaxID=767519 RepID=A0A1I6K6T3_9EURY|nr:hypothetical protein [Halomicrobium zhouii]SFR86965.1 hypothetical protein SAMN05216559_0289 [Halomicrobium zhouii]
MMGALRTDDRLTAALTGLATLGAVAVGFLVAGVPGVLAGAALVVAWLLAPPVVVVALGQVLFAPLLPADASLATIALVEAPLAAMLLVDLTDWRAPVGTLAGAVVALAAFAGLAVAGLVWFGRLWQTAALLVPVAAVVAYGLHRYTVVTVEITDEF